MSGGVAGGGERWKGSAKGGGRGGSLAVCSGWMAREGFWLRCLDVMEREGMGWDGCLNDWAGWACYVSGGCTKPSWVARLERVLDARSVVARHLPAGLGMAVISTCCNCLVLCVCRSEGLCVHTEKIIVNSLLCLAIWIFDLSHLRLRRLTFGHCPSP